MEEKKDMRDIFFGEVGITSASANETANNAKEYVDTLVKKLNNVNFVKREEALITSEDYKMTQNGWSDDDMAKVPDFLDKIAKAHSLIAWLREAIKAKDSLMRENVKMDVEAYASKFGIDMPVKPTKGYVPTKDELIGQLTVKERNRIYMLQTKAAVYGQYIHPNEYLRGNDTTFSKTLRGGSFSSARDMLKKRAEVPYETEGNGRDKIVYKYTPTVSVDDVDKMFRLLSDKHREAQKELHSILYKFENEINEAEAKASSEYSDAMEKYNAEVRALSAKCMAYAAEEAKRLSKLKIIIPNDLKAIYDEVSKADK